MPTAVAGESEYADYRDRDRARARAEANPLKGRWTVAKTYRMSRATRLINSLFRTLTRFGLGASYRNILTVRGRKTGRLYSTPVDVLELDGQRWLVAAYGPTSWVANARAAGEVTLSRGGRSQQFDVEDAASTAAVPVLRNYITEIRVTRPYFDAGPSSTDERSAVRGRSAGEPLADPGSAGANRPTPEAVALTRREPVSSPRRHERKRTEQLAGESSRQPHPRATAPRRSAGLIIPGLAWAGRVGRRRSRTGPGINPTSSPATSR